MLRRVVLPAGTNIETQDVLRRVALPAETAGPQDVLRRVALPAGTETLARDVMRSVALPVATNNDSQDVLRRAVLPGESETETQDVMRSAALPVVTGTLGLQEAIPVPSTGIDKLTEARKQVHRAKKKLLAARAIAAKRLSPFNQRRGTFGNLVWPSKNLSWEMKSAQAKTCLPQ